MFGGLINWLFGWLFDWLVCWLVGWLIECLAGLCQLVIMGIKPKVLLVDCTNSLPGADWPFTLHAHLPFSGGLICSLRGVGFSWFQGTLSVMPW